MEYLVSQNPNYNVNGPKVKKYIICKAGETKVSLRNKYGLKALDVKFIIDTKSFTDSRCLDDLLVFLEKEKIEFSL